MTAVPEGYVAYVVSEVTNTKVILKPVAGAGDILPQGTPVLIKGTARSSFTLSAIDQSIECTPVDLSLQVNFLVGSYCQKPVPAGTGFYLKNAGIGLYRATADYKLPACSCYLPSAEKRSYLGFQISEDPDGIILNEELRMKNQELFGRAVYNLSGQRLQKAQRGINIVNGEKVVRH